MPSYIERRRGSRVPVHVDATVAQQGGESVPCTLVDVGLEGLAITGLAAPPEGLVRVSFSLGEDEARFELDGMVVREEQGDAGKIWAVRFLGLEPATKMRLQSHLETASAAV